MAQPEGMWVGTGNVLQTSHKPIPPGSLDPWDRDLVTIHKVASLGECGIFTLGMARPRTEA